jgi:hypothetical protein
MLRTSFLYMMPSGHKALQPETLHLLGPLSYPPSPVRKRSTVGFVQLHGVGTLHWSGQVEVLPDQLHALSIHELKRRQDLPQHPLAGAEGLQNLSKAWTTCNGSQCLGATSKRTAVSRASPTAWPGPPSK